ncbi:MULTISPECIES: methionyl-tRNA formyltransferase [Methylosinus]|uniref:Methionyl-tRNA formyltransferase n=1 Tax=Methylosinus trichosporium (strain ATCC 35070 / NCIMB 11131 / UNIQEM 75 / OB3b) TaxID=595536 RepID=A0A2D2D423_METT3|nr:MULTISPECIES: methionyl-tRNA formyltransferase [Methylosinus]ATQ69761.1 methionyl-tRNA formyltransferase [Methylosinus trichosporium OB3b]OBS52439.1 methionyl-tRNA formyltransferase [Methylosinus sp. 3S-1]
MRVVFMGTPDFAAPLLEKIVADGHEVVAVYTRAPAPAGRGMGLKPSPVHRLAESLSIPVFTPKNFRGEETLRLFAAHDADVAVVAAYGLILPQAALDAPRLGCLNLHGSLLPRWRGAAPIQRAVMAGDSESGVMVMKMEAGLDTGPVAATARVPIGPDMSCGELHDALAMAGAELMTEALRDLERGALVFTPQPDQGVTYAQKIDKNEGRIDWRLPARALHDLVRGLSPFPGAFFESDLGHGVERVKVLRTKIEEGKGAPGEALDDRGLIACGEGALRLVEVQRGGKAPMPIEAFLRGRPLPRGQALS